jgi:hypothetical protein
MTRCLYHCQVVEQYIKPDTAEYNCPYVDVIDLVAEEDIGIPTYVVSHGWSNRYI